MPIHPDTQFHLVRNFEDLSACMRWFGEERPGWLGLDTETTGLEWWLPDSKMRVMQVGDEMTGWVIPWDFAGAFREPLRDYLHTKPVALAHAKFDMHWLRVAGFDLEDRFTNIHDVSLMAHLIDPLKSIALKSIGARWVDPMAGAGDGLLHKAFREHGWDWDTVPIDFGPYWMYAALDPVLTVHVANYLWPRVAKMCPETYETERAFSMDVAYHMEKNGVFVNSEYVEERYAVLGPYIDDLRDWVEEQTGGKVTNPNADAQVRYYLLGEGCEFTKVTPKAADILGSDSLEDALLAVGAGTEESKTVLAAATPRSGNLPDTFKGFPIKYLSLDGDALDAIGHPVADAVRLYRDQSRIRNTYLKAYREFPDAAGYLHASIKTMAAVTGRSSIEKPSMQNLPRSKHPRNSVMASPGRTLVLSDFDQIEGRLAAHLSQDQNFIDLIAEGDRRAAAGQAGYDLHSMTARLVFGISIDSPVPPEKRTIAKAITFALLYGAGPEKVALMTGLSVTEAKSFRERYLAAIPGIDRWMRRLEQEATARHRNEGAAYASNREGRRWYIPHPNDSYRLVNYVTQGEAALVLKRACLRIVEQGWQEWLRLPIHDEVMMDVPDEHVEEVLRVLPDIMRDDTYSVPLTADAHAVAVWGDAYS